MAGAKIEMDSDAAEVKRAIDGLIESAGTLKDPMDEIGSMLVASTQHNFEQEQTPEGEPWEEHAESTVARRGEDARILRDKGHLFQSITHLASSTGVEVGTNRKYAALHQFGGTEEMPAGPADVPARPYLGINDGDQREIGRILVAHFEERAQ